LGIEYKTGTAGSSITLNKGRYEQGVLICCYSGAAPSIYTLNRAAIAATLVEGSVGSSNISFLNNGDQVQIAANGNSYIYAFLIQL